MSYKIEAMIEHYTEPTIKEMLRKALNLSPVAQKQFLREFNMYSWAAAGEMGADIYVCSPRLCPEFMNEAAAAGIKIYTTGKR